MSHTLAAVECDERTGIFDDLHYGVWIYPTCVQPSQVVTEAQEAV
jgi:hypothetical protein